MVLPYPDEEQRVYLPGVMERLRSCEVPPGTVSLFLGMRRLPGHAACWSLTFEFSHGMDQRRMVPSPPSLLPLTSWAAASDHRRWHPMSDKP